MNLNEIDSITKYNKFLGHLNAFGRFQKKLIAICTMYWMFAGIVRTIFNKEVFCNDEQDLPFFTLSIIVGMFGSAYLSYYYNRRITMLVLSVIYTLGGLLLLLSFTQGFMQVGIYFILFSQYSVCALSSCIVFEYVQVKLIPTLAWLFIFSYHVTKFASLIIFSQFDDNTPVDIILSSLILIFGFFIIAGSLLFKQSLRYLIDNDIEQAEIVALQISEQNRCTEERILNIIQGSFIWNKVNIKKYGLSCFKKYKSLARETYYLGLSFFFLGVFGKFAIVTFEINQEKKSAQFQHQVQLLWISVFQLIGFLPGIILDEAIQRRKICMISSIVGLIFSMILVFLVRQIMIPHVLVAVFSLLGLNSFVGSVLFFFMFLQAIEFYPHSIRTLGLSICLCCYYMGQLVFNLHLYFINDESSSLQLVFCCSFLMILHLHNTTETLNKGVSYEIKQIEERECNED